jgi:DHA3 family macrolide efflux protein-like MFS transporter
MTTVAADNEEVCAHPSVWKNRAFVAILMGHTISVLGDGFHSVALGYWVLKTTGSGTAMAAIMSLRLVIGILLGAVSGTVADRIDRRKLMIATDLVRVPLVGALALAVTLPGTPFLVILVLSGLISACGMFFGPAFQASLTNIVDRSNLAQASGTIQLVTTLSQVVGPSLGGLVVGLFGAGIAFTGDGVSFILSAVLILAGGSFASTRLEGTTTSFWATMREGFDYIRTDPLVRSVVTLAPMVNVFANAGFGVLLPVLAIRIWRASPTQFGLLEAAFPLGMALGAAWIMSRVRRLHHRGLLINGGLVVAAMLAILQPLVGSVHWAYPVIFTTGIALALPNILLGMILQSEIPEAIQGRVFGTATSLITISSPIGFMIAGRLADIYDPVMLAVVYGVCFLTASAATFVLAKPLRNYN